MAQSRTLPDALTRASGGPYACRVGPQLPASASRVAACQGSCQEVVAIPVTEP